MSTEAAASASPGAMTEGGTAIGRPGGAPAPSTPPGADSPRSAKAAWIVIGSAMVIGAALGIFVYLRASHGSVEISKEYRHMRELGLTLEAEGCVEASLQWFENTCDAVGQMCVDAVPRMVGECLAAKDRSAACVRIGNDLKPSQWAYKRCKELGIDKGSEKSVKESCTLAWRAYDSWCKSGQKGVAL